jgi:thiamine biosynthesis lipoprotein
VWNLPGAALRRAAGFLLMGREKPENAPLTRAGRDSSEELLRLEASVDSMGSTYSVVLYGTDRDRMEETVEAAFEEVRRLDRMLSNYRADSEMTEVNRFAAERPVKVTPEFYRFVAAALEFSRLSEGAFDMTVGPLMKVWGFYKGSGRLPRKAEVASALKNVGWRNVLLNQEDRTIRFHRQGIELDPGGIGKGYAVDRMVEVLKEKGVSSAMISSAGSSIFGLGSPGASTRGWEVKIRDPKDENKTVARLFLKNQSLSTSGNYEKFFLAGGKIYSHIMDPRTGYPAKGVLSTSVVSNSTLESEAWTKPFFVLGREWAAKHKPKHLRVFLCEDKAESACAWLQ